MNPKYVASYYTDDHDRLDDVFQQFQQLKPTDLRTAAVCFNRFVQTAKAEKLSQQAVDDAKQYAVSFQGVTQDKDDQIKRQQQEIEELHKLLELRPRFGVLWDVHIQAYCPACRSVLAAYAQYVHGNGYLWGWNCIKCNRRVYLMNDHGGNVQIQWASEQIRTLMIDVSPSGKPVWK